MVILFIAGILIWGTAISTRFQSFSIQGFSFLQKAPSKAFLELGLGEIGSLQTLLLNTDPVNHTTQQAFNGTMLSSCLLA